jgi:histidinol-phosphate aminotransferase
VEDRAYAEETWRRVREARQQLTAALAALGFSVSPSQSNFLLARVPAHCPLQAGALQRHLKSRGILVRYFDTPVLADQLRISVGTGPQNRSLLDELKQVMSGALAGR